jgi:hypothetical protein
MCPRDGGCCGRGSRPKGRASRRPLRPPSAEPARWATLLGEQMGTSRGCVPTSSARIRVVAPCATVKHSRRRDSADGRAARARPASARSRARSPVSGLGPTDVRRPSPALTPPVCWCREFVFDWCPHAESGVAPAGLRKISLYPEDRVGERHASSSGACRAARSASVTTTLRSARCRCSRRWPSMAPARTCELSVNAQEVNCVVVVMDHGFAASRLALLDRHLERVCPEGGGCVLADRPHDDLLPLSRASLGELVEDLLDRPAEVLVVLGA